MTKQIPHDSPPWRPRWWWWTAFTLSLVVIYVVAGVAAALLGFGNPYLVGTIVMGGAGLRATWWVAKKEREGMSLGTWLCDHGRHRWRWELMELPAQTRDQADADGIYHPYGYYGWLSVCRRCGARKGRTRRER